MTNFIVKIKSDSNGVLDTHTVYTNAESIAEAESKVLKGLVFPPVTKVTTDEDGVEHKESVAVVLSVISIEAFPANTHLV